MNGPRRVLNIRKPYFDLIASGVKTVEVRVGYASMRKIEAGQELTFACGDERLRTRVVRVTEYGSFEEMLDHEDLVAIGGEVGRDRGGLLDMIRAIYPPEKERLGMFAIEVEKLGDSTAVTG